MVDSAKVEISPQIAELERVIKGAQRFDASLTFELQEGGQTVVRVKTEGKPAFVSYYIDSLHKYCNSLETAIVMTTEAIRNSVTRLKDVSVKSKETQITGKELKSLVTSIFCDMAGVHVPKDSELKEIAAAERNKQEEIREELLQTLRKGPEGVKYWNEGGTKQSRKEAGHFKKSDLQNLDLSGLRLFLNYYDMADFQGSDFSLSTIDRGCLDNCDFRKCNFKGASLIDTHIRGSKASDCDFSGANLEKASLRSSNLQKCTFECAMLADADMEDTDIRESNFKKANLTNVKLICSRASDCDFSSADMQHVNFFRAEMQRSVFVDTNLTGADFKFCDLKGVDLSSARMAGVTFDSTTYDEKTKFPADLSNLEGLVWKGAGPDPTMMARVKEIAAQGPVDFEDFLKKLNLAFDQERLKKAIKMLKAERFQLFAEVSDEHIVGVVKSQTDPDLVYSCRLACDGKYSCCTQNLNPCGGLRGALCKHLLVLLLGLTKAGEFDTTQACAWVITSKQQNPQLDKEIASATFLRYKGAEAGEVDWRPTETIPEDFYAF